MVVIASTRLAFANCIQPRSLLPSICRYFSHVLSCDGSWLTDVFQRGQFGEERYEKEEFQRTVRATFLALMEEDKVFFMSNICGVFVFCVSLEPCPFLVLLFLYRRYHCCKSPQEPTLFQRSHHLTAIDLAYVVK